MKCQSDYGTETDALVRQADECTEQWWEDELRKGEEPLTKGLEDEESALIVKREMRKRGLAEVSEEGGV
ncbi:MAG: hypothetical protein HY912_10005 [Desulfomonile tiedjei]|uniref:Uncharacterized protein n=1 Tax=Desulfomonile tiedjei TaxID=2358 RepID=A0A9D6V2Y7_9BACT|nr:hypothetical protein [Desulfomonile tiedjei]